MDTNNMPLYRYHYYLTDHPGNVRLVVDEKGILIQKADYYPFGLAIPLSTGTTDSLRLANKYLYNGKELQPETGLLDYGARMYDGAAGRFFTLDRFAEKYADLTGYQYGANNPILYIDVNGDSLGIDASLYQNKNIYNSFVAFAQTKEGYSFLSKYAKAGQKIDGTNIAFKSDGSLHKKNINLNYDARDTKLGEDNGGVTDAVTTKSGLEINITLNTKSDEVRMGDILGTTITIFHESFIHGDIFTKEYRDNKRLDNSYVKQFFDIKNYDKNQLQHIAVRSVYEQNETFQKYFLWGNPALRGITEAAAKINPKYTQGMLIQKMWYYTGGINLDKNGKIINKGSF